MPVEINCDTCGEMFEVDPYRKDTARFCSNDCRAAWQSDEFKGENAPNYQGKKNQYVCKNCGETFEEWPSQNSTKFCSDDCYHHWQKHYSPISVSVNNNGYPILNTRHGVAPLHRLLATLMVDDLSELRGKHVHHSDIPVWYGRNDEVNIAVTYLDNLEVKTPGEHSMHHWEESPRRGENVGPKLLSESDVREIRNKYSGGGCTYKDLAEEYGTTPSNVGLVVNRDTWSHVE